MKLPPFDLRTAPLDRGTVLLEASAGTGKTYTLVGILLRLLLERHIERLDQALVVTFTIAATEELKTRLRAGLVRTLAAVHQGDADPFFAGLAKAADAERILRQALDDFDQASIATIHGFCKRLLDESAFESHQPFRLDFTSDPLPLLYRAAADTLRGLYRPGVSTLGALLHSAQLTPQKLVELYRLWQRYPDVSVEPSPADPEPFLRDLETAIAAAAAAYTPSLRPRIVGLSWKKNDSPFADPEAELDRFEAHLATTPALALPLLCLLATESIREKIYKNSRPDLSHAFFAACDRVRAAQQDVVRHLRAQLLVRMHARLEADKGRDHLLTFDDLLERTHAALQDRQRSGPLLHALRQRYRTALIDEFQDTDSRQYGIFSTCFRGRALFLIGDPKQSIYGFRGADLRAYIAAGRDAVQKHSLDTNYRSSPELVAAVGRLFAGVDVFLSSEITARDVHAAARPGELRLDNDPGAALRWRFVPPDDDDLRNKEAAETSIAKDVAAEISRLLRAGIRLDGAPLRPHHIAILTRTNLQAITVQSELRQAGVMSAIGKAGDVFETEELVELERFLIAVLQPGNLLRARAALATRIWGYHAEELAALEHDEDRLDRELLRLDGWRRLWIRRGFVVMKEQMMADLQVQRRLLQHAGGERRLTNLQQLFELLHGAEHENRLSPEGLLEWLQHECRHQSELDYQLRELRLESDGDAVQILTVHGSKGLQYEVVFCPFLWDGRTPHAPCIAPDQNGRELLFDLAKGTTPWHIAEAERLAEDVRLCYVALTRARRRCYVHWGAIGSHAGGAWRSALTWLISPQRPVPDKGTGEPSPERVEQWAARTKKDVPRFVDYLEHLVAQNRDLMQWDLVPEAPRAEPCALPSPPVLRAIRRANRIVRPRPLHSFSSLTADAAPGQADPDVVDGPRQVPPDDDRPARGIFAFARGTAAGLCLHTVLEHVDLGRLDDTDAALVRRTLADAGLADAAAHRGELDPAAAVFDNLRDLAAAHTHPGGPTLAQLCSGARQAEWQFTLPTTHSELRLLAAAFATSTSSIARAFAARIHNLPPRTLRGFLVGFVDLIAELDGRYWVLDWKSNHLGNDVADYSATAIGEAMHDHDYVLQYHLYVLALHRHLRARLRDYDYERHFGGVCYVFLRGAMPGNSNGMFFDRVPFELVDRMDRWALGALEGGAS